MGQSTVPSLLYEVWLTEEESILIMMGWLMILSGTVTMVLLTCTTWKAAYGRYSQDTLCNKVYVPCQLAWFLQELPSLVVPILVICTTECSQINSWPNRLVLFLYILHYFQRAIIYPLLISGGKPTPLHIFMLACLFCVYNGYMQGSYHAKYARFDQAHSFFTSLHVYIGLILFFTGMFINLQSDRILRNLRQPGETGYRIPEGGMFNLVSGANFLGEIVEWIGYATVCQTLPAVAFAYFTICNIGPRAIAHHTYAFANIIVQNVCRTIANILWSRPKKKTN